MSLRFTFDIPRSEIVRWTQSMFLVGVAADLAATKWAHKWALKLTAEAKKNLAGREGYPKRIDDGTLRASVHPVFDDEKLLVYVVTELHYAIHVHFGTGKYAEDGGGRQTPWVYFDEKRGQFFVTEGMPANPFMRLAFEQNHQRAMKDFERIYEAELRRLFR